MGRTGCPSTEEFFSLEKSSLFENGPGNHDPQTSLNISRWKMFFMPPQTSLIPTQHPLRFLFLLLSPTREEIICKSLFNNYMYPQKSTSCLHATKAKTVVFFCSANISTDHRYLLIKHGVLCRNTLRKQAATLRKLFIFLTRFCDIIPLLAFN